MIDVTKKKMPSSQNEVTRSCGRVQATIGDGKDGKVGIFLTGLMASPMNALFVIFHERKYHII